MQKFSCVEVTSLKLKNEPNFHLLFWRSINKDPLHSKEIENKLLSFNANGTRKTEMPVSCRQEHLFVTQDYNNIL